MPTGRKTPLVCVNVTNLFCCSGEVVVVYASSMVASEQSSEWGPGAPASTSGMWSLILYVLAVVVGLALIWFYEPKDEKEVQLHVSQARRKPKDYRLSSLFAVLGVDYSSTNHFEAFQEHFHSFDEVSIACRRAGLEHSNLIIGVDFTASNEWQGRKSFNQNCLHKVIGNKVYNPYQKVIWILGHTLKPFDEDNMIPAYGFGDSETTDEEVFSFKGDDLACQGFEEVLDRYNEVVKGITLSGPTSFAPIIAKAIQVVKNTKTYHILVIIADGQVTEERPTIDAIVEASKHPISIIVVGVGDGPWDVMEEFDHRLPKRKFDNFRFVDYHKTIFKAKHPDTAFALQALMEIPDQYKMIRTLGHLDDCPPDGATGDTGSCGSQSSSPKHSTPRDSPRHSPHHSPRDSPRDSPSPRRSGLRARVRSGSSCSSYSTSV